ncbi:GGDEF domain-containing protein [Fusibacter paucivorans]|uniref:GGDEF domain-containing protein n=1 Tax=Fusibacter paucivorans TaxID=76009 RepID=A0ABS5PP15_9FIRM|nr:GGDEF domain-containing protein [Fusibacter paucivorans]MBS7526919.1 GGDEF domain-containing protein [Fusibacter paucivorans]
MEKILDFMVLATTMSVFLMHMDFRYNMKKVITLFISFGVISFVVYSLLLVEGFERTVASSVCFSIPSLFFCLWMAKYRDARFVFTFAIVDLIGMTAVILGRCISIPFDYDPTVVFVATVTLLALYFAGAVKFRHHYLEVLRTVSRGWGNMALAAILIYIFTLVLVGYPSPLYTRREYVPVILIYIAVFAVFLKVLYEAARSNINVYIEKMENENLKMKLELNQVYYDMAYVDRLTGVKNRNAFEAYLEDLRNDLNKGIICVSLDIDNLKHVNDEIGHHAGDALIQKFGYLLTAVFDSDESIFRIGGDEFVVIAENGSDTWLFDKFRKMDCLSETIRNEVEFPFEYARGMSKGNASEIRTLLKQADAAMYHDKERHKA